MDPGKRRAGHRPTLVFNRTTVLVRHHIQRCGYFPLHESHYGEEGQCFFRTNAIATFLAWYSYIWFFPERRGRGFKWNGGSRKLTTTLGDHRIGSITFVVRNYGLMIGDGNSEDKCTVISPFKYM